MPKRVNACRGIPDPERTVPMLVEAVKLCYGMFDHDPELAQRWPLASNWVKKTIAAVEATP